MYRIVSHCLALYRIVSHCIALYRIESQVKELQRRGDPNVVIALAGNKADMEAKRKVQTEEAQLYADENQIIYMETSAKSSQNVRNLFNEIAKKLPR